MTYEINQEKFHGPLDLLLDLIESEKLSINEIALAKVTDEFISYFKKLEGNGKADPEILAEFLVVASQLLLIKSRSLLPGYQSSPEEKASVLELEERLREYQKIRSTLAEWAVAARGGQKSFAREAYANRDPIFAPSKNIALATLKAAYESVRQAIPKVEKLAEEKIKKIISLEEKVRELEKFLAIKTEQLFSKLVSGTRDRVEVIVSFLAVLELAKQRLISVEQRERFGDIRIRRNG